MKTEAFFEGKAPESGYKSLPKKKILALMGNKLADVFDNVKEIYHELEAINKDDDLSDYLKKLLKLLTDIDYRYAELSIIANKKPEMKLVVLNSVRSFIEIHTKDVYFMCENGKPELNPEFNLSENNTQWYERLNEYDRNIISLIQQDKE